MSIIRSSLRTRILQLADAVNSPRWDPTAGAGGEVDQHMGIVHSREWRRILNANPYHRVSSRTVTTDTLGRVSVASLSDTSVLDSAERFYKILLFTVANTVLKESPAKDGFLSTISNDQVSGLGFGFYFRNGDYFVAPGHPNESATIWVNHLPTRADNLSTDNVSVNFPDDYEDVLAYETASILLSKGAAEMDASASMKALAEDMRRDMLQDIARTSLNPLVMQFPDLAMEWGG